MRLLYRYYSICEAASHKLSWTLHIRQTATTEWRQEDAFEFRIMDSPHASEQAIRDKVAEGYAAG